MPVALFISDLHLCPTRPAIAALFQEFLARQARQADALYILGDLFEYWAGDDSLGDAFNKAICAALKALADQGTQLRFIAGNRDFLVGSRFSDASGAHLLTDPTLTEIGGAPTLLMHGDTLCTGDVTYQAFRSTVRSAEWRETFLARPLAERKALIEELRRNSEREKQIKSAADMDVAPATVAEVLRRHGYPRLIHGHTHRPAHHCHALDGKNCERWVLGDWYTRGSYLRCDETGCQPLTLPAL